MRNDGVAVFSGSGGSGALWTDALHERGLRLGRLGGETRSRLAEDLPPTHRDLPIDLGVVAQTPRPDREAIGRIVSTVMADPDIGAGFYVMTTQPDMEGAASTISEAGTRCGKPLLFVNLAGSSGEAARRVLRDRHHLSFETPDEALRTLKALAADLALRRAYEARGRESAQRSVVPAPDLQGLPPGPLTEAEAKSLLLRVGIPVAREHVAATAEEAAAAAGRIGYPVVLKGSARGLVHKSDLGAVRLGLSDAAAVEGAFDKIRDALARAGYGPERFGGCLVQEMVDADVELILGTRHDPQFGPIVVVGIGGIAVELVRDVRLLPAPTARADVLDALRALTLFPLLGGYRGKTVVDLDSIADAAVRIGDLAVLLGPKLVELEINPLLVRGVRIVAADAHAVIVPTN